MPLPLLAARSRPEIHLEPASPPVPSPQEWAARRAEIERLYVCERRKLRYIVQYMESTHRFKATEQMYKKRFARWGFQKNRRRTGDAPAKAPTDTPCCLSKAVSPLIGPRNSMPAVPGVNDDDRVLLTVLTNVRNYSTAFFQSLQTPDATLAPSHRHLSKDPALLAKSKETSFAFKLVIDLLGKGYGDLAGRVARKAFLLVESMLALEGPALVWNLLEMMHNMVIRRQTRLFRMLLLHLVALVDSRMPRNHPLPTMLRGLHGLASSSPSASRVDTSSPLPLASLLERAWRLNAEILFDHFDTRLFYLYFCIHWDSCSISPPDAIFGAAGRWIDQNGGARPAATRAEQFFYITPAEEREVIRGLLAPQTESLPPLNFEMLRAHSIAALWRCGRAILNRPSRSSGGADTMLRILAGLVTAEVFERWPATVEAPRGKPAIPRAHAEHFACAVRTLMDVDPSYRHGMDAVAWNRSIVALREHGDKSTSPLILREMWLLNDAIVAAGEQQEAREVAQVALHRVRQYIEDIPIDSV